MTHEESNKLRVLDLFSGIGGFSLGLDATDQFETVTFCEIGKFPRKVLAKHWPEVPCYDDVRAVNVELLRSSGIGVDVITGGFPCQDISIAGKRAGIVDGTRSGLWSEIDRLIGELSPSYVIVENVSNLLNGPSERPGGWFGRVLGDLAERGYDAEWASVLGTDVGVPQSRPRVFVVAYPSRGGERPVFYQDAFHAPGHNTWLHERGEDVPDIDDEDSRSRAMPLLGYAPRASIPNRERSGSNERLSSGLDRYKGLGNTVIPQIVNRIGHLILQAEGRTARSA